MSRRLTMAAILLTSGLALESCASGGGSASVYYDPYPYRTGIYYYHDHTYRPNRPPHTRPPNTRPPSRPPGRPTTLPARGGRGRR